MRGRLEVDCTGASRVLAEYWRGRRDVPGKALPDPEYVLYTKVLQAVFRDTPYATAIHLENGIELIVQPETVSATVSVYGHIRNEPGLQTLPRQEGVDRVLDRLLETARRARIASRFRRRSTISARTRARAPISCCRCLGLDRTTKGAAI